MKLWEDISKRKEKKFDARSLNQGGRPHMIEKEKLNNKLMIQLNEDEYRFIDQQRQEECQSKNGIVRRAIKLYRKSLEKQ